MDKKTMESLGLNIEEGEKVPHLKLVHSAPQKAWKVCVRCEGGGYDPDRGIDCERCEGHGGYEE